MTHYLKKAEHQRCSAFSALLGQFCLYAISVKSSFFFASSFFFSEIRRWTSKSKAQAEGIAAAHLKGVKFGRPKCKVENWDTYYGQWKAGQITAVQCYKQLGISASTFYRLVREYETEEKMT